MARVPTKDQSNMAVLQWPSGHAFDGLKETETESKLLAPAQARWAEAVRGTLSRHKSHIEDGNIVRQREGRND